MNLRKVLVDKAPSLLRIPVAVTPFFVQKHILLAGLQRVFAEACADGELDFLQGRWLLIEVCDLNLRWFISYDGGRFINQKSRDKYDVTFRANAKDLLLIAGRREDPDTLFFQRRLKIEGDTELGLEVKNLMDSLDWDSLPPVLARSISGVADFVEAADAGTAKAA